MFEVKQDSEGQDYINVANVRITWISANTRSWTKNPCVNIRAYQKPGIDESLHRHGADIEITQSGVIGEVIMVFAHFLATKKLF